MTSAMLHARVMAAEDAVATASRAASAADQAYTMAVRAQARRNTVDTVLRVAKTCRVSRDADAALEAREAVLIKARAELGTALRREARAARAARQPHQFELGL